MHKPWVEFWGLVLSVGFLAGVLGNLVASAVLGIPALLHLHRKMERHHEHIMQEVRSGRE